MSVRCAKCGIETDPGNFCPQCGSPLPQPVQQTPQPPQYTPPQPPQYTPPQQQAQYPPQPPVPPAQPVASYQPPPQVPQPPQYPPHPPVAPHQPQGYPPTPPHQPQGYPPQQPWAQPGGPMPARKSGGGWVKWLLGIIGVIILLFAGLVVLGMMVEDEPVTPPPASNSGATNTPTPAKPDPAPARKEPAPSATGFKATLVKQGRLAGTTRGQKYDVYGPYLAEAINGKAILYEFDRQGNARPINTVEDIQSGELLSISVGNMFNKGTPLMVVVYETKIYVVPPGGDAQPINNNGTRQVLMGDYDGDGKTETIFLAERAFNVYRYEEGGDTRPIYRKENAANPFPSVFASRLKAGSRELLHGYTWENDKLSLLLYKWDGLGGPVAIGKYQVNDPDSAQWMGSAPSSLGATLILGRSGSPGTVEFFQISKDAKSATSLGSLKAPGKGVAAPMMSTFTQSGNQELLLIDEAGAYFLYKVSPK